MSNAEGPETRDDAASPEDATVPAEASEEAETEFHPFDDVTDAFGEPEQGRYVEGPDSMPAQVSQATESDVPALSPKTLVCMGDYTSFVCDLRGKRFFFAAENVRRHANGAWCVSAELFWEVAVEALPNSTKEDFLRRYEKDGCAVQPLRPPCEHYVRQMTAFKFNAQHQSVARLCAARRTTEGTFMGLSDTGVYACDMRRPRDLESERLLDEFDARKVREGAQREFLPMTATEAGGIFGPPVTPGEAG